MNSAVLPSKHYQIISEIFDIQQCLRDLQNKIQTQIGNTSSILNNLVEKNFVIDDWYFSPQHLQSVFEEMKNRMASETVLRVQIVF